MKFRSFLLAALLSLLAPAFGLAETPPSPLHTFYGQVKAVDLKARTFTIKSNGKSFVFLITNETKISSFNGHVSWETVRLGQGATVVMRLGEGNKGIAVKVRFEDGPGSTSLLPYYSARTVHGEIVSGIAVSNYVAFEPPADAWMSGITYELKHASMFVLSVRPDGTVAEAKTLHGLGYPELDARAIKWLKKWRFHPNSVTEVRMPISYSQWRNY